MYRLFVYRFVIFICAASVALTVLGQSATTRIPPAAAVPAAATTSPAEFVSNEGGFRVMFPAAPKSIVSEQTLPSGTTPYYQFVAAKAGVVYLVSYLDHARPFSSDGAIKTFFDQARTRAIADGQKLVKENEVSADGVAGREFVTDDSDSRIFTRQFVSGRRQFQLIAGMKLASATPNGADVKTAQIAAFFNSFHLLNKAPDRTAYPRANESDAEPLLGVRGLVEGNHYRNDVLSISMNLPDGWQVIDDKQFAYANTRGSRSAGQPGINDSIDRSLKGTAILVAVSKYILGTNRNATMVMSLERLGDPAQTSQSIAAGALAAMKSALPLRVVKDVNMTRAGGVDFATFSIAVDLSDGTFQQTYFVVNRRGQAMTVVFSYVLDDDAQVMERSLLSLRFALH